METNFSCFGGPSIFSKLTEFGIVMARASDFTKKVTRIYSDLFYMSEAGVASLMLVLKFSRSGRITATAVWCASSKLEFEGSPRVPENRPRRVQQQRPPEGVESIGQESPVGDHHANGGIDSEMRTRKAQMRATRFGLESSRADGSRMMIRF